VVRIRVRLGAGLNRLADAPLLAVELADAATVEDLLAAVAAEQPSLGPALRSVLTVVRGEQLERSSPLAQGDEVALLIPVAGGAGPQRGA
jgi:molybdopterin synthase catalytic subunit/molybdopterin synthase sulfur carrier subunit